MIQTISRISFPTKIGIIESPKRTTARILNRFHAEMRRARKNLSSLKVRYGTQKSPKNTKPVLQASLVADFDPKPTGPGSQNSQKSHVRFLNSSFGAEILSLTSVLYFWDSFMILKDIPHFVRGRYLPWSSRKNVSKLSRKTRNTDQEYIASTPPTLPRTTPKRSRSGSRTKPRAKRPRSGKSSQTFQK